MTLTLTLLGSPRARDGDSRPLELTGITGELLALLLVSPSERNSRDYVCDCLWPDGDPQRNRRNLNTTLWRLRSMLEPGSAGTYFSSSSRGFLSFNRDADYRCDVEELERSLVGIPATGQMSEPDREQLRRAVGLYRGELLQGSMSEWLLPHRDRLARIYQECLVRLMRATAACGELDESIHWAEMILDQDPLREDVHRALIETYDRAGRRTLALRQYDRMRDILETELNTRPSRETQALYYRVIEQAEDTEPADRRSEGADIGEVVELLAGIQRQLAEGMALLAQHLANR